MQLNLLSKGYKLKIDHQQPEKKVWDIIRKKWVAFTPEEMVRQLFIQYMISDRKVNVSKIAVEKEIKLSKKVKRCDIIIYHEDITPKMIIECKSPEVKLDDKALSQVVRYNQALDALYLCITNGLELHTFIKNEDGYWIQSSEFAY